MQKLIKKLNLELIHYGSNSFEKDWFAPVKNSGFLNKPEGGLWASPVNSEYGWIDWCKSENFMLQKLEKSFKFNCNGSFIVINKPEDLEELPLCFEEHFIEIGLKFSYFDFEKIAKEVDGVYLTEAGQYRTRLSFPLNLYGWDCESVLIFNPDVIKYGG